MQIKTCILLVALVCELHKSHGALKARMKDIKTKAKQFYNTKFGNVKMNFLGVDASEFPGTNPEYRKINKHKWEHYYSCLEMHKKNLGSQKTVIPEAVETIEGGYIRLECKICLSPMHASQIESVEWLWAPEANKKLEQIELTENIFIGPEDRSLEIYNLMMEYTGQYMCVLGKSQTAPYFLTVTKSTLEIAKVHSKFAHNGPYPRLSEVIPEYNLVLSTEWGPWSDCNKCGTVGRKYKLGICMVALEASGATSIVEQNRTKRDAEKVTEMDLELMKVFKYGIPCRSHILPKSIKKLPMVEERKSEIMIGYCKHVCPEEMVFEVKDNLGRVIERANNSAGIYSMVQGLPPIEPRVERRLQYEEAGKQITLRCPGNLNSRAPVEWQVGGANMVPNVITRESNGRIYITLLDRIHITSAKVSDSNIYSCWQHKTLAGTIRLVVEKRFKMGFNHHIMLLGIIIILSTFLFVFAKAFLGRRFVKGA